MIYLFIVTIAKYLSSKFHEIAHKHPFTQINANKHIEQNNRGVNASLHVSTIQIKYTRQKRAISDVCPEIPLAAEPERQCGRPQALRIIQRACAAKRIHNAFYIVPLDVLVNLIRCVVW